MGNKNKRSVSTLMLVENLNLLSFFPIFKIFWKHGSVSIYFLQHTRRGKKLTRFLERVGIVSGKPIQISNPSTGADSPDALDWDLNYRVLKICQSKLEQVEGITNTFFQGEKGNTRVLMANNVVVAWAENIFWPNLLLVLADRMAIELNVSSDRVFVASAFASLSKTLDVSYPGVKSRLIQQPFRNKTILFFLWTIYLSFRNLFSKSCKSENTIAQIGFSGWFDLKKNNEKFINDLFWWREQHIPGNRLVYLLSRPGFSPCMEGAQKAESLGIKTVLLNPLAAHINPTIPMSKKAHNPFSVRVKILFLSCKLFLQTLFFDDLRKSATAFLIRQYVEAIRLASFYKFLNLKGLLEGGHAWPDWFSLAADLSDSVRIGFQKSCLNTVSYPGLQIEPVYFAWGAHDTNILLASGAITRHMLISGCILNDNCNEQAQKTAKDYSSQLRHQGVKYIVSFFDGSLPPLNIYRGFLQWLIDDPRLGLLIKSKGNVWSGIEADGLDGLVVQAQKTRRMHVLPSTASPADAAISADFSVGFFSYSAIVTSALKGARILYLNYERIEEPQNYFCTLHSLGPNRCVFNDFDSMKRAVIEYVKNPKNNPDLGDATPVLDHFDPFRDGKAGDRISEYVSWYLEGLDKGISRDDALNLATQKYADKWGADKVIRGL
jgi:hypothetical protein